MGALGAAPLAAAGATTRPAAGTAGVATEARLAQAAPPPTGRDVIVTELSKTLSVPVTTYLVEAQDPAGGSLSYSWTMTATDPLGRCGTPLVPWTRTGSEVPWSHFEGPPDNCIHQSTPSHPVRAVATITVLDGPDKGATAACTLIGTLTEKIDDPASACTFTPAPSAAAAQPPLPVVHAAAPASPPTHKGSSAGGLLGAAAAGILAVGAGVVVLIRRKQDVPVVPAHPEEDWKAYVSQEETIQAELLGSFQALMADVAANQAQYNAAFDQYRTTYSRVLSGSTEMQGMMQAWMESKDTLEKADLAFAVLTLLVSGVGLGLKGIQILRGARVTAATLDAVRAAEAAKTSANAARAAEAAVGVGKGQFRVLATTDAKIAELLAKEAGVSLSETLAKHGGSSSAAVAELAQRVFSQRGWHYLAKTGSVMAGKEVDVAEVVSRVVTNTRTALGAAAKRSRLTTAAFEGTRAGGVYGPSAAQLKQDIQVLQELARRDPRFLQSLRTAVVDVQEAALTTGIGSDVEIGSQGLRGQLQVALSKGNAAEVTRLGDLLAKAERAGIELAAETPGRITARILTDADHALLLKVVESGGDIAKVRAAVGPAQTILLEEIVGRAGVVAVSESVTRQAMLNTFETGTETHITDAAHFVNEFGVANRYDSSSNFATFMAGEAWHLLSAPFTTVGEYWYSNEALDAQATFMQNHGGDLQVLASALQHATNSLGNMQRAIKNAHLGDPSSALGGRGASDLRNILDKMKNALDAAGPGFHAQHEPEYRDRAAHVAQKLDTLQHATDALKALATKLPQMEKWLNELRVAPDGSARPVTQGIDPNALMRIGSGFMYLNGVLGSLAAGSGTVAVEEPVAPAITPTTEAKPKPDCSDKRSAWGAAHRRVANLESRDSVGKAGEALAAAKAEEDSARRDLAQRTPDGSYPPAVRSGADRAQYDAGRQAAQTRVAEAVKGVSAAEDALREAQQELADAKAEEEAARKALEDCEKAAAGG